MTDAVFDGVSSERRRNMQAVKRRDTEPEMAVRRYLHSLGFRYRIDDLRMPGRPDLVLRKHRTVVFVHGCFWHGHPECSRGRPPKTRTEYWIEKVARNKRRDAEAREALLALGWKVLVVWGCQTKSPETLAAVLQPLIRAGLDDGALRP